jgi:aminoglycoside N3'-acetyltransferase
VLSAFFAVQQNERSRVPATREQLVSAIRFLGVRPGDLMIAHSSYKSFDPADPNDRVAGGPAAVAQALVDAVSPKGSAFVPTYNYGNDPWDPAAAPSYDGVVTECFRKLPGAVRSQHPTHAIAGVGPVAREILEGHERTEPFGRGSPCWRLWERDAWVLLIGVGHESDSVAHVAEELLAMPYLDRRRTARIVRADGAIEQVTLRRPGCSDAWHAVLDPPLRAMNAIAETTVGRSKLTLVRARAVVAAAGELLKRDPAGLLCARPECDACAAARAMLRAGV